MEPPWSRSSRLGYIFVSLQKVITMPLCKIVYVTFFITVIETSYSSFSLWWEYSRCIKTGLKLFPPFSTPMPAEDGFAPLTFEWWGKCSATVPLPQAWKCVYFVWYMAFFITVIETSYSSFSLWWEFSRCIKTVFKLFPPFSIPMPVEDGFEPLTFEWRGKCPATELPRSGNVYNWSDIWHFLLLS